MFWLIKYEKLYVLFLGGVLNVSIRFNMFLLLYFFIGFMVVNFRMKRLLV